MEYDKEYVEALFNKVHKLSEENNKLKRIIGELEEDVCNLELHLSLFLPESSESLH